MSQTKKHTKGAATKATSDQESNEHAPPLYDPLEGKKALAAIGQELAALDEGELVVPRVDVEMATFAALGVAGLLGSPEVRARFARLPAEEIDHASVDGLAPACFAMLYVLAEARAAGALETDAKIAASVVTEASEVEQRMQRLCEYHFADDRKIRPELDRLRPGAGHRDLANDLLGYARIYGLQPDVVKGDATYYRAGDAPRARELAGVIIQSLSAAMTPRARNSYEIYLRVWAILDRRYTEVRAAGLWLFRKDTRREELFPSLFTAGRSNVGRPRKEESDSTNDQTGAATPAGKAPETNGAIV